MRLKDYFLKLNARSHGIMAEKFNNIGLWDITFYRLDDEGNPYKKNGKVVVYEADTDFADTLDWVQLEDLEEKN